MVLVNNGKIDVLDFVILQPSAKSTTASLDHHKMIAKIDLFEKICRNSF